MYATEQAVIWHVPKCGGRVVRKALNRRKLLVRAIRRHPCPFDVNVPRQAKGRMQITLVRHPLSWYRSFWLWANAKKGRKRKRGRKARTWWAQYMLKHELSPLVHCSETMEDFMLNVSVHAPGAATRLMGAFARTSDRLVHVENLFEELADALMAAGEDVDHTTFAKTRFGDFRRKQRPKIPRYVAERLMQEDRVGAERFGYGQLYPDYLVKSN